MVVNFRRTFLKSSLLGTVMIVMSNGELFGATSVLSSIAVVQKDLFPHAATFGTNPNPYLAFILHHPRVRDDEKEFIRNGVQWLNEEAVSLYKKMYVALSNSERQNVLKSISQQRWGENWIDAILTYIMEASFGDPIYGGNKNEAGWKWLEFQGGLPRPKSIYI